jgi:hypothetical protein
MTIKPGQPWGRAVARPDDLVVVGSDAELASMLSIGTGTAIGVDGGDLARTLGVTPTSAVSAATRPTVNEFPIDLLEVHIDTADEPLLACAHVIARSPSSRGGWLRGRIVAVMNAEFIDRWDVAPRGHLNDGRVEVLDVAPSMTVRERLAARRRLANATHVPHPRIATRSVRSASWDFETPLDVFVDGRRVGRTTTLSIAVVADAAHVYA